MAIEDFSTNFYFFLRWLHIFAGIVWIGHLYFFNFVNLTFQPKIGADVKKVVNPILLGRALWWFRWGAMITFIIGDIYYVWYYFIDGAWKTADGVVSERFMWITFGALLGTIMWFNVWFIIWPAQKKLLSGQATGEQADVLRNRALLASRINTYLSAPMLFGMVAGGGHYSSINLVTLLIVIIIAEVSIWLAYKYSTKVGTIFDPK
jgi:uncharacterized membrane protein